MPSLLKRHTSKLNDDPISAIPQRQPSRVQRMGEENTDQIHAQYLKHRRQFLKKCDHEILKIRRIHNTLHNLHELQHKLYAAQKVVKRAESKVYWCTNANKATVNKLYTKLYDVQKNDQAQYDDRCHKDLQKIKEIQKKANGRYDDLSKKDQKQINDLIKQITILKTQHHNHIREIKKACQRKAEICKQSYSHKAAANKQNYRHKISANKQDYLNKTNKCKQDTKAYEQKYLKKIAKGKQDIKAYKQKLDKQTAQIEDVFHHKAAQNKDWYKSNVDTIQTKAKVAVHDLQKKLKSLEFDYQGQTADLHDVDKTNRHLWSLLAKVRPEKLHLIYLVEKRADLEQIYASAKVHNTKREAHFRKHINKLWTNWINLRIKRSQSKMEIDTVKQSRIHLKQQYRLIVRRQHEYDANSRKLNNYKGNPYAKPYKRAIKFHARNARKLNVMIDHYDVQLRQFEQKRSVVFKRFLGHHLGKRTRDAQRRLKNVIESFKQHQQVRQAEQAEMAKRIQMINQVILKNLVTEY